MLTTIQPAVLLDALIVSLAGVLIGVILSVSGMLLLGFRRPNQKIVLVRRPECQPTSRKAA